MDVRESGETNSIWEKDAEELPLRELQEDLVVDVCVIGAGFSGLLSAYLLAKEGKSVCVLEAAPRICAGQTLKTTAQLCVSLDIPYSKLLKIHDEEGIAMIAESHRMAMAKIEEIANVEEISCELRRVPGYLFLASESPISHLEEEYEAVKMAGVPGTRMLPGLPLDFLKAGPCLEFPHQLEINPIAFMKGIAQRALALGVKIYVNSPVLTVKGGEQAVVQTDQSASVTSDSLIVATNTPVNNIFAVHTKQAPYRTYVVGYAIPKGLVNGFFWDTETPQHYVRVIRNNDIHDVLLVGGEDHKTGQNSDPRSCFVRLEDWAERRFPVMGRPLWRWSGQIMQSMDGLGFLGHNPADEENVYVISGDSGNGLTHGTIGAMLIADQIQNRENPWESLYSPGRFNLMATGTYVSENVNVAKQYMDWFHRESPDAIKDLSVGEGVVINQGLKKIAVYHNEGGGLEFYSAMCPHLAGVVRWNSVEKSWDCPCHGSRFDCHGRVIEGPALTSLSRVDIGEQPERQAEL